MPELCVSENLYVATPPRVHRTQLTKALDRIAKRRAKIDDQRFASGDCESPGQVLDYIGRHPTRYPWVAQADIDDGLVLWVWQWWEGQRQLYRLLTCGRDHGKPYKQMGMPLGLGLNARKGKTKVRNQRQGVKDLIDRLESLLKRGGRPDAELSREARRAEREGAAKKDPELAWLTRYHPLVVSVADQLLAVKNFVEGEAYEEAYSWLVEVEKDRRADEWSPGSLTVMKTFVEELRTQENVFELASQTKVKRACHAVDELVTAFTNLVDPYVDDIPVLYTL